MVWRASTRPPLFVAIYGIVFLPRYAACKVVRFLSWAARLSFRPPLPLRRFGGTTLGPRRCTTAPRPDTLQKHASKLNFGLQHLGKHVRVLMAERLEVSERVDTQAADPRKGTVEGLQFRHGKGEQVLIVGGGVLHEQVTRQAADQSGHAIFHSDDRRGGQAEAWRRSKREVVQPAEKRGGSWLPLHELECRTEVGIVRKQVALLAGWRCEPVAPQRDFVDDRSKL